MALEIINTVFISGECVVFWTKKSLIAKRNIKKCSNRYSILVPTKQAKQEKMCFIPTSHPTTVPNHPSVILFFFLKNRALPVCSDKPQ